MGWKTPETVFNRKTNQVIGKRTRTNYKSYKALVHEVALQHITEALTGPILMVLNIYLKRVGKFIWKTRPMPPILHDKAKDLTNFEKGVEDALEGIAFLNDGQIAKHDTTKWYCAGQGYGDTRPRVEVELIPLNYDGTKRKGGL